MVAARLEVPHRAAAQRDAPRGQVDGRLFEALGEGRDARVVDTGRITAREPPSRFVLEWRAVNFAPEETTEVEVSFAAQGQRHARHAPTPWLEPHPC